MNCAGCFSPRITLAGFVFVNLDFTPQWISPLCMQEMKYIRDSLRIRLWWDSFDLTLLKYDPGHGGKWRKSLFWQQYLHLIILN